MMECTMRYDEVREDDNTTIEDSLQMLNFQPKSDFTGIIAAISLFD